MITTIVPADEEKKRGKFLQCVPAISVYLLIGVRNAYVCCIYIYTMQLLTRVTFASGFIIPISFGMMAGWPSISFTYLLSPQSPVPITLDQTALIAGFLMEGNAVGAFFSSASFLNSKAGVLIAFILQIFGWICMYSADNVWKFFVSRFCIGFANTFGTGQLKRYIQETCDDSLVDAFNKFLPLSLNFGVLLAFIIGIFVDYSNFSLICSMIPAAGMIVFLVIPKKVIGFYEKRAEIVKSVLRNKASYPVAKYESNAKCKDGEINTQSSFMEAIKDKHVLRTWLWIAFLVFVQQYCGGPAHVVYAEIIQRFAGNPFPAVSAAVYAFFGVFSEIIVLHVTNKSRVQMNYMFCSVICAMLLGLMSAYFFLDLRTHGAYVPWLPLFMLVLFNFFHSYGVVTAPLSLINQRVPKTAIKWTKTLYVVHVSMSAVVSTKIFQTIFTYVSIEAAYIYLASILLVSFFVVLVFFKNKNEQTADNKLKNNTSDNISVIEISRL